MVYIEGDGNPWAVGKLRSAILTEELKGELRGQYSSEPTLLSFIGNIRHFSSPDVCPMCGSLKPGTVDHVFPKRSYPEFSIFSRNLVPACDCNTKRGESLKGSRRNQRVLHPYFDKVLDRRIIRADIQESIDGYVRPIIDLKISIRSTHRFYSVVKYHLENVLQRTDVIPYLDTFWLKILRNPDDNLRLPAGLFTEADFDLAVSTQLGILDRRRSTPNNWDSMLFAGLDANRGAKRFLKRWVEGVRARTINPEVI